MDPSVLFSGHLARLDRLWKAAGAGLASAEGMGRWGGRGDSWIPLVSSVASDVRPPAFRSTLSPSSLGALSKSLTPSVPQLPLCEVGVIFVCTSQNRGDS